MILLKYPDELSMMLMLIVKVFTISPIQKRRQEYSAVYMCLQCSRVLGWQYDTDNNSDHKWVELTAQKMRISRISRFMGNVIVPLPTSYQDFRHIPSTSIPQHYSVHNATWGTILKWGKWLIGFEMVSLSDLYVVSYQHCVRGVNQMY